MVVKESPKQSSNCIWDWLWKKVPNRVQAPTQKCLAILGAVFVAILVWALVAAPLRGELGTHTDTGTDTHTQTDTDTDTRTATDTDTTTRTDTDTGTDTRTDTDLKLDIPH